MQRPERGFLTHTLKGQRCGGVLGRPTSVWEVNACPAAIGDVDERPAATGRRMCVRRHSGRRRHVRRCSERRMRVWRWLGKAERSGRSQRGDAVPADGRAIDDFSWLVGGGLSGLTGTRVPRGRERLDRERADGFDPDSVGRESCGRKPVGPACKTRPA
jgi:hypothetical protein